MRSSSTCISKLIVILVMLGYDEVKNISELWIDSYTCTELKNSPSVYFVFVNNFNPYLKIEGLHYFQLICNLFFSTRM